ncbi:putative pseudouridine synthase [Podospora fimiseda]|uniref:Pseudouridine synthase n=1 Tax=Podospora fimiseda TaxID=252190 RepID=A0AAN7BWP0_9PEZI|nr:putative pseudouridine synthase [Podospora fimiseda]
MAARPGNHLPTVRADTEKNLGILLRSSPLNFGWVADTRKRYTDFLVYEIKKDGTVIHLYDYEEIKGSAQPDKTENKRDSNSSDSLALVLRAETPQPSPELVTEITSDDREKLVKLVGVRATEELVQFDQRIQSKKPMSYAERTVIFDAGTDRTQRTLTHQEIRRIFHSRMETTSDNTGRITTTQAKWTTAKRNNNKNNRTNFNHGAHREERPERSNNPRAHELSQSWSQVGGDYLHMTLYKENKDTMEAVNTIARLMKIKSSLFGFAGTKDRRAATTQRISVHHQKAAQLLWLNTRLDLVKIGDFSYSKKPLQLGDHGGNEFVITLKNCHPQNGYSCSVAQRLRMVQQAVECGLSYLKHHGYINYFGLQRFGTYTIGTHLLGLKILQGDFEGFVDDVMHVDEFYIQEAFNRTAPQALAPNTARRTPDNNRDDVERARAITLWKTTRQANKALEVLPKRFSSETALIRHLGKNPKDFTGAILSITRGLRQMYLHAYQSYVWNHVATYRWSTYGSKVVVGDLILVNGTRSKSPDGEVEVYDDLDGEVKDFAEAYALTAEDLATNQYTIFDVVLPLAGYDVLYPQNDVGKFYIEFMSKDGIDPREMRRKNREFSLSGAYRHLLGRFITEPQYAIRAYIDDTEQMYPTDLDFATHKKKLAQQAEVKARLGVQSSSAKGWADFAANPAVYDEAIDKEAEAQRRRKAEEEPSSSKMTVTNERWVQTGIDGSSKRVKLARHQQQIEERDFVSNSPAAESVAESITAQASETATSIRDDDSICSPPGGAPLYPTPGGALYPTPRFVTAHSAPPPPFPALKTVKPGPLSISEAYYANGGDDPFGDAEEFGGFETPKGLEFILSKLPPEFKKFREERDAQRSLVVPSPEVTALANEFKKFHEERNTQPSFVVPSQEVTAQANDVKMNDIPGFPNDAVINGIRLPEWRTVADNPLLTLNEVDTENLDPRARKIAVILKFQLKQSNYATIVLRELMGNFTE